MKLPPLFIVGIFFSALTLFSLFTLHLRLPSRCAAARARLERQRAESKNTNLRNDDVETLAFLALFCDTKGNGDLQQDLKRFNRPLNPLISTTPIPTTIASSFLTFTLFEDSKNNLKGI